MEITAKKCQHVEDGQGWTLWDRVALAEAKEYEPGKYATAKLVKAKICGKCGDMMAERIEYE